MKPRMFLRRCKDFANEVSGSALTNSLVISCWMLSDVAASTPVLARLTLTTDSMSRTNKESGVRPCCTRSSELYMLITGLPSGPLTTPGNDSSSFMARVRSLGLVYVSLTGSVVLVSGSNAVYSSQ